MSRAGAPGPVLAFATVATVICGGPVAGAAPPTTGTAGRAPATLPYVLPDDVRITSLFTVGDRTAGNGFRMVGIPDGLGLAKDDGKLIRWT